MPLITSIDWENRGEIYWEWEEFTAICEFGKKAIDELRHPMPILFSQEV